VPAYLPPHKGTDDLANPADRLEMLKLALEDQACFEIDEYEMGRKEISYSIDTIRHMNSIFPGHRLFWIMGMDMLIYIEKWHDFRNVLNEIEIMVLKRKGFGHKKIYDYISLLEERYEAKILLAEIDPVDISSSMIRKSIKSGKSIQKFVHKNVEQYIINNKLYV
jgi:nicotinate-nucleotide adenylyltransferase